MYKQCNRWGIFRAIARFIGIQGRCGHRTECSNFPGEVSELGKKTDNEDARVEKARKRLNKVPRGPQTTWIKYLQAHVDALVDELLENEKMYRKRQRSVGKGEGQN